MGLLCTPRVRTWLSTISAAVWLEGVRVTTTILLEMDGLGVFLSLDHTILPCAALGFVNGMRRD